MELLLRIQKRFGITLPEADALGAETLSALLSRPAPKERALATSDRLGADGPAAHRRRSNEAALALSRD
jgi:hypothetical protein